MKPPEQTHCPQKHGFTWKTRRGALAAPRDPPQRRALTAAAEPLLNIHGGQRLAVPSLCQSAASGLVIKAALSSLKSSDSCDRGEVAGWRGPDLSEVDRHEAREEGRRLVTDVPRHPARSLKVAAHSCLFFLCFTERYKK